MLRGFISVLVLLLLSQACFTQKTERPKKERSEKTAKQTDVKKTDDLATGLNKINVTIYIDHYYPYCGGAYPDESQMNNYQPMNYSHFVLVNLVTAEKTLVQTDSLGFLRLSLVPGKYGIKELFKNCTFEEFMKNHPITSHPDEENAGEDCYKKWWASYLGEFTVTDTTQQLHAKYTLYDQCFTGNNPCISYTGPYPP